MTILGIDGALGDFSAAVVREGEVVASVQLGVNDALEGGIGAIESVLARAGIAAPDQVAVGIGPGGFTGLRIAIAYAKSLAQAWRVPLAGISSFDLLEYDRSLDRVLTVVRGRKGVVSARLRDRTIQRRHSGLVADVIEATMPDDRSVALTVIGGAQDVLDALGERAIIVQTVEPLVAVPAVAAALLAMQRPAAASLHEVRADYGERPAAKVPQR